MRAPLHLGQGQGWRGSGILNWYDKTQWSIDVDQLEDELQLLIT